MISVFSSQKKLFNAFDSSRNSEVLFVTTYSGVIMSIKLELHSPLHRVKRNKMLQNFKLCSIFGTTLYSRIMFEFNLHFPYQYNFNS